MLALLVCAVVAAPNVIFLTVDTLRADHLGCYGYPYATSPHIDALAQKALVFDDFVCEVPLTSPSFGAMLSSRYPRLTGTTRNGLPMPDSVPLVTEVFKAAGYATLCVQSNWTLKAKLSGLERGFDVYDEQFKKRRWGFLKSERTADEVTEAALRLLAERDKSKPLFAWIHYSDPHAPYTFRRKFDPMKGEKTLDKVGKTRRRYDSEIAFMDHHVGRILGSLPTENTFIVFLSDHGESLYEHGYLGHGRRIYQPGLRIPFMVSGPGIEPGRTTLPGRGVDVGPTLLGLANLDGLEGMLGVDVLRRRSFAGRVRVVETYGGAVPNLPGAKAIMADDPPMWQGALFEGWKLVVDRDTDEAELFFLENDPLEMCDLAEKEPARAARLEEFIESWMREHGKASYEAAELSREDQEALRSLGYTE